MDIRNLAGGVFLIGFASAYALAASNLRMTSSLGIGSGLFPMLLAGILALIGLIIVARAWLVPSASGQGEVEPPVPVRGIALITLAPAVFAMLVVPLGVVPALFLAVLVSALANRSTSLLAAIGVSIFMVAFCVALFRWGLGLPLTLFSPHLNFMQ